MLKIIIQTLGWVLAYSPEPIPRFLSALLGDFIYFLMGKRRRLVLANLHHAFPERSRAWHRRTARLSCRRTIETFLFALATPFFSDRRVAETMRLSENALRYFRDVEAQPRPVVICTPHLGYWEMQTMLPAAYPGNFPNCGVIYRPMDNPVAEAWLKKTRERFGLHLLSRKQGLQQAMKILRGKGIIALLFDQNTGKQGALIMFLDRLASASELPGVLTERFDADAIATYPRRTGFWKAEFCVEFLRTGGPAADATLAVNAWLEQALRRDDDLCASWLWLHNRWKAHESPHERLRIEGKRNLLAPQMALRGWKQLPRKTRIWIRLPNWLGDVVMALPLIRAIRQGRPDAELTLLAPAPICALLERLLPDEAVRPLPAAGWRRLRLFRSWAGDYPDTIVLFTNSARGDLEARLTGCRQRFGLVRPGRPRPVLSHPFHVPEKLLQPETHQTELWRAFLERYGLQESPDFTPFVPDFSGPDPDGDWPAMPDGRIGLICGSENFPAKRWPVAAWRELIARLQAEHPGMGFLLFGTAPDSDTCAAIAEGQDERTLNLAGRTTLPELARLLGSCRAVVGNDTGGLHLANALGVPILGLYGPTNPLRTAPVFCAPRIILQPTEAPPTGGTPLSSLSPDEVHAKLQSLLAGSGEAVQGQNESDPRERDDAVTLAE